MYIISTDINRVIIRDHIRTGTISIGGNSSLGIKNTINDPSLCIACFTSRIIQETTDPEIKIK